MDKKPLLVPLFSTDIRQMRLVRDLWLELSELDKLEVEKEARDNLKIIKESLKYLYENGVF